jgi:predicted house-cleaning NTP pyrophosphatase (Maf/HAM1 superfamily)
MKSSQPEALAALERAAVKALELARRTGTPAYVMEGDKIVDIARRRPGKRKNKS